MLIRVYYSTEHGGLSRMGEKAAGQFRGKLPRFYVSCASTKKTPAATACTFQGAKGCFHWRGGGRSTPHLTPLPLGGGQGDSSGGSCPIFMFHAQAPKNLLRQQHVLFKDQRAVSMGGAGGAAPRIESPPLGGGQGVGQFRGKLPHFYVSCASTGKSPPPHLTYS